MEAVNDLLASCAPELRVRRVLTLRHAARTALRHPGCDLLADVAALPARTAASDGTSFVWHAAQRYVDLPSAGHAAALATCCYDAYRDLLPPHARPPSAASTVLPKLGAMLDAGEPQAIRPAPESILAATDCGIGVISTASTELFDDESNRLIVEGGAREFADLVSAALDGIAAISADLHRRVLDDVAWVVRVDSPSAHVHRSFTTASLDDVVFLSHVPATQVGADRVVAEAIVHERSHLHVHRLLNVVTLHALDDCEQFYSPWRNDPRPLNGLLHGTYVLARLCELYGAAIDSPAAADDELRHFYLHRLSWCRTSATLGLMQIPLDALTPEGRILVDGMREATEVDAPDPDPAAVDAVRAHLELWRTENDELAPQVRVPQWL